MRNVSTWGGPMLLVALVVMMASVSVVEAVDVQGTWDATFACTSYRNAAQPEKFTMADAIRISQTGRALAINSGFFGDFRRP